MSKDILSLNDRELISLIFKDLSEDDPLMPKQETHSYTHTIEGAKCIVIATTTMQIPSPSTKGLNKYLEIKNKVIFDIQEKNYTDDDITKALEQNEVVILSPNSYIVAFMADQIGLWPLLLPPVLPQES